MYFLHKWFLLDLGNSTSRTFCFVGLSFLPREDLRRGIHYSWHFVLLTYCLKNLSIKNNPLAIGLFVCLSSKYRRRLFPGSSSSRSSKSVTTRLSVLIINFAHLYLCPLKSIKFKHGRWWRKVWWNAACYGTTTRRRSARGNVYNDNFDGGWALKLAG